MYGGEFNCEVQRGSRIPTKLLGDLSAREPAIEQRLNLIPFFLAQVRIGHVQFPLAGEAAQINAPEPPHTIRSCTSELNPQVSMNRALANEITRLGGDPTDDFWIWLVTRGPHGPTFTLGQTRSEPPGYIGVSHLQEIVGELVLCIPAFHERALRVANLAMGSEFPELARRAVQVAAVIGGNAELQRIKQLASSQDAAVASDARASAFYLKGRC